MSMRECVHAARDFDSMEAPPPYPRSPGHYRLLIVQLKGHEGRRKSSGAAVRDHASFIGKCGRSRVVLRIDSATMIAARVPHRSDAGGP